MVKSADTSTNLNVLVYDGFWERFLGSNCQDKTSLWLAIVKTFFPGSTYGFHKFHCSRRIIWIATSDSGLPIFPVAWIWAPCVMDCSPISSPSTEMIFVLSVSAIDLMPSTGCSSWMTRALRATSITLPVMVISSVIWFVPSAGEVGVLLNSWILSAWWGWDQVPIYASTSPKINGGGAILDLLRYLHSP